MSGTEREPCPPNLDEDGQQLWAMCDWVLVSGAVNPSVATQLQALAIRRELRLESINAELIAACKAALASLEEPIAGMLRAAIAKAKGV